MISSTEYYSGFFSRSIAVTLELLQKITQSAFKAYAAGGKIEATAAAAATFN